MTGEALKEYAKRKADFEKKWKRWGWYSIVHQIAEGGVFNKDGLTPIDSAYEANFLEAITWLAESTDFGRV